MLFLMILSSHTLACGVSNSLAAVAKSREKVASTRNVVRTFDQANVCGNSSIHRVARQLVVLDRCEVFDTLAVSNRLEILRSTSGQSKCRIVDWFDVSSTLNVERKLRVPTYFAASRMHNVLTLQNY